MTILAFLDFLKGALTDVYGVAEATALGKHLLQERLAMSFSDIKMREGQLLDPDIEHQLMEDTGRLLKGEPVQYVVGYTWFNELKLEVNKSVLIPRPETEELISFIVEQKFGEEASFLDIGTGNGCIALSLKSYFPAASIVGADISDEALAVAENNSRKLNLPVHWVKWDVLSENNPDNLVLELDLIVSNPPYICMKEFDALPVNVREHEPHLALFVPDNDPMLFYRKIAVYAMKQLKEGGRLWFEINQEYAEMVAVLLETLQFSDVRIYTDLAGNDRFVSAVKY